MRRFQRIQNVQENKLEKKETHCKLLNLCGYQVISPLAEFWIISTETACWEIEEKTQIFNEDFTCRSTFLYAAISSSQSTEMDSFVISPGWNKAKVAGPQVHLSPLPPQPLLFSSVYCNIL